jgi:BMFP domain-containing protein YqiC
LNLFRVWWSGLVKPNGLRSPVARTILLEHALTSSGETSAMQSQNRFFDDFARMAGGAMGALGGIRQEIEGAFCSEQMERWLASMDLVTREEFDAVHTMAAKARAEQERLEQRVAALEASLAESAPAKGRAVRSRASKPANPASFAEGSGAED